jgi:hypothetical protein
MPKAQRESASHVRPLLVAQKISPKVHATGFEEQHIGAASRAIATLGRASAEEQSTFHEHWPVVTGVAVALDDSANHQGPHFDHCHVTNTAALWNIRVKDGDATLVLREWGNDFYHGTRIARVIGAGYFIVVDNDPSYR